MKGLKFSATLCVTSIHSNLSIYPGVFVAVPLIYPNVWLIICSSFNNIFLSLSTLNVLVPERYIRIILSLVLVNSRI
jgi:hypothetical protein